MPKKGDPRRCDKNRGISKLDADGKIVEHLLLQKFQEFLDEINYIPETQFGFTAGCSTVDALLIDRFLSASARDRDVRLYKVYIDLVKAYDRVHRPTLWLLLQRLGCPPKLLAMVKAF